MTMADRIVVMHDGIIEQIGTPLQLFDRPGNLFVAQFIGSPSMNVVKGTLRKHASGDRVEAEGHAWPAPELASARDGHAVHYGIRPTDIQICAAAEGVPAKVIVVEPTGAETELLLQVGDTKMIVVTHGRTMVQPDDMVGLRIDPAKVHVFDQGSGAPRID
jgi:multiple sugar transport system ATP-binding protein